MEKLRAGAAQMATLESVMAPEVSPGIEAMEATGGFLSGLGVSPRLYRVMGVSSFLIGWCRWKNVPSGCIFPPWALI